MRREMGMTGDKETGARMSAELGIVVIGRNEGKRLVGCLASAPTEIRCRVYVDSGSTDDSAQSARQLGFPVVALDSSRPFSAARARNAGAKFLLASHPGLSFIQFVDGDCELRDGWLELAMRFLAQHADVAMVCGRRRERRPSASVYNFLCDLEWDTPIGEALSCGGDSMARADAFHAVGGFNEGLIAGEEPELCLRLREAGWSIWRLDAEMTLHDAALTRFGQWWRRSIRGGHGMAQVVALHWRKPAAIWKKSLVSAMVWGLLAPTLIFGLALRWPIALVGLLIYPAQIARIAITTASTAHRSWTYAVFIILTKFAEVRGAANYALHVVSRRAPKLIEYKGAQVADHAAGVSANQP